MSEIVEITALGHGGDGVTADGLFVPLTLPGDVVRIVRNGGRGRLQEIISAGRMRITPACAHFGICGGCALQMMTRESYLEWKRDTVVAALSQRGFRDPLVDQVHAIPPGTRRRAVLKARRAESGVALGFYEAESHRLVDIRECPVLAPELAQLIAPVKRKLADILRPAEQAELHITATDTGVDLSLNYKRGRDPELLTQLALFAEELDVARLCWNREPVAVRRTPILGMAGVPVALPPESFLQPTAAGEKFLQDRVSQCIEDRANVADLFCGCGTFTLALVRRARVQAIDVSPPQVEALAQSARQSRLNVKVESRDLFRRPLSSSELRQFDVVILDPPRPGASAQCRELAQSSVPSILYVSCNPASFARDARTLCDAGFRLFRVTPVDQFVWSPHIELFAEFRR